MLRYHLVRTLHLTDPLPTDACSLNVSANLITAAAAWVKADIPRQIAFVLEYECDDKTYGSMPSFDMLEGRDAALAQLLREVCDGDGQASCSSLFLCCILLFISFVGCSQFTRLAYAAPAEVFARCCPSVGTGGGGEKNMVDQLMTRATTVPTSIQVGS